MARRISPVIRLVNRTATQNLAEFVRAARVSPAFGHVPFEDPIWKVPAATATRPQGSQTATLVFSEDPRSSHSATGLFVSMKEPFCSFVKSLVRLNEQSRHVAVNTHRRTIAASRVLYKASADIDYDPRLMSSATFHQAAALITAALARGECSSNTAYSLGKVLEGIADTVTQAGISEKRIDFSNTIPRPPAGRLNEGEDPRLPTNAALKALFEASNIVTEPPDILLIRMIELLTCAPWRINEILRLPVDCEVREPKYENGVQVVNEQGEPVFRYGIRYSGSKGFLADVKWIPTAMVSVATRAIAQIRELTAASREVAIWNEANPERSWLHAPYGGEDIDRSLSADEVADALGLGPECAVSGFAQRHGIRPTIHSRRHRTYPQREVEDGMRRMRKALSDNSMKLSEYLFVVPRYFLARNRPTLLPVVDLVSHGQVTIFLTGKPAAPSIFERLDLRDEDGRPFRLCTHQLRHLLNTIAAENGLGELERARWSGRTDIEQNAVYDHETGYQLAEKARAMLEQGRMAGPIAVTFERLPPVERKAFSLVHLATVHTTDIGMCLHDWGTAPCPHHGACASCRDCAVMKGDPVHRLRTENLLREEEATLERALAEVEDGTYGASNFVEHHRRMAAGYRRMLAVHDDPLIEDGTLVQIEPEPARQGLLEDAALVA